MAQTVYSSLANYVVNPTENDHNGDQDDGAGRCLQEIKLSPLWHRSMGHSGCVISGFTMPGADSGLTHDVAYGDAIIEGYHITGTDAESVTFTDTATNWVWLQLIYTSSKVVRPQLYIDTGAARPSGPSNSIFLGNVVCSGGNVASSNNYSKEGRVSYGSVTSGGAVGTPGSGDWSVSSSVGTYTITFEVAFARAPLAIATLRDASGAAGYTIFAVAASTTVITVNTQNPTPTAAAAEFTFWAFL